MWQGDLSCNSSWGSLSIRDIHTAAPKGNVGRSGSCALVRRHGSCRSRAQSLCQPLGVILHGVGGRSQESSPILWEDGSSGLHGYDVRVQTPRPFTGILRHGNTRKEFQRHTENPESTFLLVH